MITVALVATWITTVVIVAAVLLPSMNWLEPDG
jgi:hypothetical protein